MYHIWFIFKMSLSEWNSIKNYEHDENVMNFFGIKRLWYIEYYTNKNETKICTEIQTYRTWHTIQNYQGYFIVALASIACSCVCRFSTKQYLNFLTSITSVVTVFCGDSYFCISMLVDSIGLLMPMRYVCNASVSYTHLTLPTILLV